MRCVTLAQTALAGAVRACVALGAIGCSLDSGGTGLANPVPPAIASTLISPNPYNALSAAVTFHSHGADSARVRYQATSSDATTNAPTERVTPFFPVRGDSGTIAVLGLRANTSYSIVLQLLGAGGGGDTSATLNVQTGPLPPALAALQLNVTGAATSGYTLTDFTASAAAYIVAFDETGVVCWYREFAAHSGESALDAEQQTNGDYTLFVGASTGWQPDPGRFYEVRPTGELVQTYAAAAPYYTDQHELRLDFTAGSLDRSHILGYEFRHVDLTAIGGTANQLVAGHVILRQLPSGTTEFAWNAWDHFTIDDWIFVQPGLAALPSIDFDHPNSLTKDIDGNYLVSFASLGLIAKIDAASGDILWRLGGRTNQFTLVGDPLGGFGIQHDVRLLPNGNLLFIDNGIRHSPPETRAVEYKLDLVAHTATLVWQYRHTPPVFAPFAGSAQRLANGNTFVAFGATAQVAEVTPAGAVVWEAQMTNNGQRVPYLYRAARLASLYRPEAR